MENGQSVPHCREYTIESRRLAIERVVKAMRERLAEPLSLDDMARVAYLSPFHFNRVFHQVAGLPPTKFLYALRLKEASRLLLTTHMSVTDVCYEVGYNSLGTFTTRFKRLVGLTPCHLRGLAEQLTPATFQGLCRAYAVEAQGEQRPPAVAGRVSAPDGFRGFIFVGLFPSFIPQSRPVAGSILTAPGAYAIAGAPDGRYHLFAVAFPESDDALTYLLPGHEGLLVGVCPSPVDVVHGRAARRVDLSLRPMSLTDPPLLISLPSLITEFFKGGEAAGEPQPGGDALLVAAEEAPPPPRETRP